MLGSIPDVEVVTASTGMSWIVSPGLYGPSSFRIAAAAAATFFARSGFVGPRFANVVAPALYAGAVAEGRSWKYCGFANDCAASLEPTTFPLRVIRLPFAWLLNATWAKPVKSAGRARPNTTVSTTIAITEDFRSRSISGSALRRAGRG